MNKISIYDKRRKVYKKMMIIIPSIISYLLGIFGVYVFWNINTIAKILCIIAFVAPTIILVLWGINEIQDIMHRNKLNGTKNDLQELPKNDKFEALVIEINKKVRNLIVEFINCYKGSFDNIESMGHNVLTNSIGYYMKEEGQPEKTIKEIQELVCKHNYFDKTPYINRIKEFDKPINNILEIITKYKNEIAKESEIPIEENNKLKSFLSEITPYNAITN